MSPIYRFVTVLVIAVVWQGCQSPVSEISNGNKQEIFNSRVTRFQLELVAQGLKVPWSMDWLPDGRALITDRRAGAIYMLPLNDTTLTAICNEPKAFTKLDSGMREVLVPPNYSQNGWIYLSYDRSRADSSSTLVVERAKILDNCLTDREELFVALPWYKSGYHYGGRLLWQDEHLFITVGDRHFRDSAQVLHTHNGKVIRLLPDGTIPPDNPFVDQPGALPEIWSYGHRNPQGLTLHPETGEIWEHEHGPKGGDEINIIKRGENYGWPITTYGGEYEGGPVGEGITHYEGTQQPFRHYSPSVAPSGMTFYTGNHIPEWQGSLFFGAMSQRNLYRLGFKEGKLRSEERLLGHKGWRIRFVQQGPDRLLYFGTSDGQIWRIKPVALAGDR